MNLYKRVFTICVFFGYVVVGLATLDSHDNQLVWVGQTIALPCGKHNDLGIHRRIWHKDTEVLTANHMVMTLDERVHVTDNGTLEISRATYQDSGQYKCVVNSHPKPTTHKINVTVQKAPSITCSTPESIANGQLHFSVEREDAIFIFGDHVRYTCHIGFSLVGSETRNCSLPDKGWDGEAPSCILEDVATVSGHLKSLENKFRDKFASLETRVKQLEIEADFRKCSKFDVEDMDKEVNHVNFTADYLDADLNELGVRDGSVVSEYVWIVENIEDKIAEYVRMNKSLAFIKSKPFYTRIPGYKMELILYPNDNNSKHVGLFAYLLPGKFDDCMKWPFNNAYVLSFGSHDQSAVSKTINPSDSNCKFGRPITYYGCGYDTFIDHKTLIEKRHLYQKDGNIRAKISVFFNN